MPDRGLDPNAITFCILIGEYYKADKIEEALAFWEELQRHGVMPNISNYNSVINAFCKKGRISVASNLLKDALDKGLIPDVIARDVSKSAWNL